MADLSQHSAHADLSSLLSPAPGKRASQTHGLGGHAASNGKAGAAHQRETKTLFSGHFMNLVDRRRGNESLISPGESETRYLVSYTVRDAKARTFMPGDSLPLRG